MMYDGSGLGATLGAQAMVDANGYLHYGPESARQLSYQGRGAVQQQQMPPQTARRKTITHFNHLYR